MVQPIEWVVMYNIVQIWIIRIKQFNLVYSSTPSILDTKLQNCKDLPFHFKNVNIPAQGQP